MSPAWIRPRAVAVTKRNPRGRTFQVLYRRGGRGYPILSAGTFKTEKDAKARRDLVSGWLARGLNPKDEIAKLSLEPEKVKPLRVWADEYAASRVDAASEYQRKIPTHLKRILPELGDRDPASLTVSDVQQWVARNADLKPNSIARYMNTLRLLLDFAGADPNPARDRRVRLPRVDAVTIVPPSAREVLAMLDRIGGKYRLPLITIEQTAMAIGETLALEWGDVDVAESRFRLRRETVKGQIRARARWVQVPGWLLEHIAATCPLEDRTATRRVFASVTINGTWSAMDRACRAAGLPTFSPHDLRHRRISLWHGQGIPAKQLAERAGHTKASMSLDIYSHVMPLDEASVEALERMLVVTP